MKNGIMKNGIMKNGIMLLFVLVLAACSSSHDVVHNGFLQKKKYSKGYNLSFKKKIKKADSKTVAVEKEDKFVLIEPKEEVDLKPLEATKLVNINAQYIQEEQVLETSSQNEDLTNVAVASPINKALDFFNKQKRVKFSSFFNEDEEVYKTNRLISAIGIMLIPFLFGIHILNRLKKIGKEKINKSKEFNQQAKKVFIFFLIGFLMLFTVIAALVFEAQNAGPTIITWSLALAIVFILLLIPLTINIAKSLSKLLKSLEVLGEGKTIETNDTVNNDNKRRLKRKALYAFGIGVLSILLGILLSGIQLLPFIFMYGGLVFILAALVILLQSALVSNVYKEG
jgi:hypothetical protein